MLRIQLLGVFHITYQGETLSGFDSPRLQSLLAFLLLHRDAPQSRKHLAFLLWTDSSEKQALSNLRNLLHRLRALLPESDRLLSVDAQTLLWRSDAPFTLDVAEFEELASGEENTIRRLSDAIALYRGKLLPSCYDDWLLPERERLHEVYMDTLAQLIQLFEQGQDLRMAIGYARRLLQADPLNEGAYRQLMRLYSVSGDRAGVVRIYQSCVAVLQQELDAEPSAETRELFQELRNTVITEWAGTPRKKADTHHLPAQLTSFVGRVRELEEIASLLLDQRLVTLTGAGGSGKTRLAIQFAYELVGRNEPKSNQVFGSRSTIGRDPDQRGLNAFADGVWFVDLGALSDPTLVSQTVASTLRVRKQQRRSYTETLADFLQSKELLLVLDNCEHVLTTCRELVTTILSSCPHVKILATSREPLKLAGETVWFTPALSLPETGRASVELLADSDAVQLFIDRALTVLPSFTVNSMNAAVVSQICQRLDGIPLAIELTTARVRTLTLSQIAARLDASLEVLTRGSSSPVARHQTLRATIDWSYDLLSAGERAFFHRLAVFAGGFTLEAVEQICADDVFAIDDGISPHQVLDLLSDLVDKSLVMVVDREQEENARYRLLEPIRQYARGKLENSKELGLFCSRHLSFYLALAKEAEPKLRGQAQRRWLDRLAHEHDNLRAALAWSLSSVETCELGLRLASSLVWFWRLQDYLAEGRRWLELGLQAFTGATVSRAKALYGVGTIASFQFENAVARSYLSESVKLWRTLDDKQGLAFALGQLARVAWDEGKYDEWRALNEETITLFRETGDRWGLAITLTYFGAIADRAQDLVRARSNLEESIILWRELGDRWEYALALINFGEVARQEGNYQQAAAFYEESMTLIGELGNKRDLLIPLHNFGQVLNRLGDYARAAQQFRQALTLSLEMADHALIAACLVGLAGAEGGEGKLVEAARLFGAGEAMFELASRRLDPVDAADYEYNLAALQARLDPAQFTAAWGEGHVQILRHDPEQTIEKAVDFGLRQYPESLVEQ